MSLLRVVIIEIHVTKNKTSVVLSDFRDNFLFEGSTGSTGLKGKKRSQRANLITTIAELYKAGKRIPMSLLKSRTKA